MPLTHNNCRSARCSTTLKVWRRPFDIRAQRFCVSKLQRSTFRLGVLVQSPVEVKEGLDIGECLARVLVMRLRISLAKRANAKLTLRPQQLEIHPVEWRIPRRRNLLNGLVNCRETEEKQLSCFPRLIRRK